MIALTTIATFIAALLLAASLLYPIVTRRFMMRDRLARLRSDPQPATDAGTHPAREFLAWLGTRLPLHAHNRVTYEKLIIAAGYGTEALRAWTGARILLASGFPAAFLLVLAVQGRLAASQLTLLLSLLLAITGFLTPTFWLQHLVARRRMTIFHTLPDLLDLLTICVESGLGITGAIVKTCDNPLLSGNPLAEELKIAMMEERAGKPRSEALKDMAARTMVEDLKAFVAVLNQTERFGTGVGQAMRVHAHSLRVTRRQHAEEAAAKTAVKMLFPLIFFIFPALLVVVLGPTLFKLNLLLK